MHIPVSFPDKEMHKLLWDYGIQSDHSISARRSDLVIINNNQEEKRELAKLWTSMPWLTTE